MDKVGLIVLGFGFGYTAADLYWRYLRSRIKR